MEHTKYDNRIRKLIEDCERLTVAGDKSAPRHLRALKQIAEELSDYALLGFVHFYYANWYFDASQYEKFQNSLKQAINALLRSDSYALLARSYNFFAINAQINDVYDVAYSYYMSALRFAKRSKEDGVAGIVIQNLANFYHEIGDTEQARKFFRKSIELIGRKKDDPFYYRNTLIVHINDGERFLQVKDLAGARKPHKKVGIILREHPEVNYPDVMLSYYFFAAHLAMMEGEDEKTEELLEKVIGEINKESLLLLEIQDVRNFCFSLMEFGHMDALTKLLSVIRPYIKQSDFTHSKRVFAEIECEYYERMQDDAKAVEAMRDQHRLILKQQEEKARIYQYSMELINLVGELQSEEMKMRRENAHLQIEIETDFLTGIPNRYALDKELSAAFERAYHGRQVLGVAIMDVDGFKNYNDKYGHQVGDEYLRRVGGILKTLAEKEHFFCARYGGDEFVAIFENKSDDEVLKIAGRIGKAVKEKVNVTKKGKKIAPVSLSQGICCDIPKDYNKPWDFLSGADGLLYAVKGREKDSILINNLPRFG